MSGADDRDTPFYGRARIGAAIASVGTACILALFSPEPNPTIIGLFLGFAGGVLGLHELNRRLR